MKTVSSSMHVFGAMRAPGVLIDCVPHAKPTPDRITQTVAGVWASPRVSTWVDLPAPSLWPAPEPALLLSITIAPLRFAPVSWAPPTVLVSPWARPAVPSTIAFEQVAPVGGALRVPWYRRRNFALGMTAAVVATAGAVAALVANL